MASRVLAFAEDDVIDLVTDHYVAVAADDWYQRRRRDAEGDFFRKVAAQEPPIRVKHESRQGIYCLTADGELLNCTLAPGPSPTAISPRDLVYECLDRFRHLAEHRKHPPVEDAGPEDPAFRRVPPKGGLIAEVSTRILDRDGAGWTKGKCAVTGGDQAARDRLWLTASEVEMLVPGPLPRGRTYPVPVAISRRLLRFHLADNTRGETVLWQAHEVRRDRLTLTVEADDGDEIRLRLDGEALLATDADPARADRGYEARVRGALAYRRSARAFERFDLVAVGDHWGEDNHTGGARPGRTSLGVAVSLATTGRPADRIPPQAARELQLYFTVGRRR